MKDKKILRLEWPRWQGGMNPNYIIGEKVLEAIVPESSNAITRKISCPDSGRKGSVIDEQEALVEQNAAALKLLNEIEPDSVVVLGGDCSVSQVPFAWLHKKYGKNFGVIWMDAHPDISRIGQTRHLHEMPVANLLGLNQEAAVSRIEDPMNPDHILYAGLIKEDLRPMDQAALDLHIAILSPEQLRENPDTVTDWIRKNHIEYTAVHWDLDVLSPYDFYSIYPNQPGTAIKDFPAAVGRLSLQQAGNLLLQIQKASNLVGLTIAEHLPWDAIRLHDLFVKLEIMH